MQLLLLSAQVIACGFIALDFRAPKYGKVEFLDRVAGALDRGSSATFSMAASKSANLGGTMKLYSKLSALGAVLVMTAAFASATSIGSDQSNVKYVGFLPEGTNPYPSPSTFAQFGIPQSTYNLTNVTPTWDAALPGSSWVGVATTAGPSGTVNPNKGFYLFSYTFTGADNRLSVLAVEADDTTSVWYNNTQIIMQGNLGSDAHCAEGAPSCIDSKYGVLVGPEVTIAAGNTLYFVVQQAGTQPGGGTGNPSGLNFAATTLVASTQSNPVPEPSSLLMLGTGLVGSAGMMMRRMRAARK